MRFILWKVEYVDIFDSMCMDNSSAEPFYNSLLQPTTLFKSLQWS